MPALLIGLLPILQQVLGSIIPDPQAQQKAINEILDRAQRGDLAQIEVNKAEAASGNIFVAGWRPFIGWVCGVAVMWDLVLMKVALTIASFAGEKYVTAILNMPKLDTEGDLWVLLGSLLGIGSLRTIEKIKGVTK